MLEYVVNSGAWSLGGLVFGYFLGRMERLRGINEKMEDADDNP